MAKTVEFYGKSGVITKVLEYEGMYLPLRMADVAERAPKIKDFKYRDGDVIVSTYPKTGTHWIAELVNMVVKGSLEHVQPGGSSLELSLNFDALNDIPSPRLLGTHFPFRLLPDEHKQKRGKLIHLLRNPKDTMVSMYHFIQKVTTVQYKGTWGDFFNNILEGKVLYGDFVDYIKEWEAVLKANPEYEILTIFYEDLQKDCMKELKRICKYLELERSDVLLQSIIDACTIDNCKQEVLNNPLKMKFIETVSVDKTPIFYRKGAVGDWKNHFTVAQNELYDTILKKKLADSKFKFTYELET